MKWGYGDALLYLLCKVKQKPFKCSDGTIRFLYKNSDDFVKDVINKMVVGMRISVNEAGIPSVEPNFRMSQEELRNNVDEIVEQTRLHMKALYETYSINPCDEKNYQLFQKSILKVIEIGSIIRTLKETVKQSQSLDSRYEQLKKLTESGFDDSETVKMAKRALKHPKEDYKESIPLEISELINMLKEKLYELTNSNQDSSNIKKKKTVS